jgi:hypothetical protein
MYGRSFTYNGVDSDDMNLMIGGFQTTDIPLNMKRSTTASSINKYRRRVNVYGINYDSVLTFTIHIMRDVCKFQDQKDLKFSRQELRKIAAWLTSPNTPRLFHMYDYEPGQTEYDYYGVFTNVETADNNPYVINCTFECNTPYALSSEQTYTIDDASGVVKNLSDEYEDYVYPVITITPTISGNHSITLRNLSDGNRHVTLKNMQLQNPVVMDCQKMTITDRYGTLISFDDLEIDEQDYIYWFRLIRGDNRITVTNNAIVEFKFRYPVKVGAY